MNYYDGGYGREFWEGIKKRGLIWAEDKKCKEDMIRRAVIEREVDEKCREKGKIRRAVI